MGTFIVGTVVSCVIGLAARRVYRDRKNGKVCGSGCASCPYSTGCSEADNGKC